MGARRLRQVPPPSLAHLAGLGRPLWAPYLLVGSMTHDDPAASPRALLLVGETRVA